MAAGKKAGFIEAPRLKGHNSKIILHLVQTPTDLIEVRMIDDFPSEIGKA